MSTTTELKQQLAELRKLAEAVTQWSNCNQAWLDTAEDVPAATVGHINEDGEKYPVAVIDCDQYYAAQDSIKLARFYASANPDAILSLANRIAELEAELAGRTAAHGEPGKEGEWTDEQIDSMVRAACHSDPVMTSGEYCLTVDEVRALLSAPAQPVERPDAVELLQRIDDEYCASGDLGMTTLSMIRAAMSTPSEKP